MVTPPSGTYSSDAAIPCMASATGTASFVIYQASCTGGTCSGGWTVDGDLYGTGNFQPGQTRCRCLPSSGVTFTSTGSLGGTATSMKTSTTCTTLGATSCT